MRNSPITIRAAIYGSIRRSTAVAALLLCTGLLASAQDPTCETPSLGDVARQTRKQNSAPGHVLGKQLVDEEEDGPDTTGVWRVRLCTKTPCNELSVALPKDTKWTRSKDEPRPVLIPLPNQNQSQDQRQDKNTSRAIRLYEAQFPLGPGPYYTPVYGQNYTTFPGQVDPSKRLFLQSWFSRPEYFGQGARISQDEHLQVDNSNAVISHFSVAATESRFLGLSIIVASANGNYGFACVYREEDAGEAASICDAILRSARSQALDQGLRPLYPGYQPPQYYPYYPRIDDPAPDPPGPQYSED
jgi:hypothetical protein